MAANEISDEENDQNAFWYFVAALRVLSHDAETQCEEMGNYNTPWEIRSDVTYGASIADSMVIPLTQKQRQKISGIASSLQLLPDEAIEPTGMTMTTHVGCLAAMKHPAWEPLRRAAQDVLVELGPAIEENRRYFRVE